MAAISMLPEEVEAVVVEPLGGALNNFRGWKSVVVVGASVCSCCGTDWSTCIGSGAGEEVGEGSRRRAIGFFDGAC